MSFHSLGLELQTLSRTLWWDFRPPQLCWLFRASEMAVLTHMLVIILAFLYPVSESALGAWTTASPLIFTVVHEVDIFSLLFCNEQTKTQTGLVPWSRWYNWEDRGRAAREVCLPGSLSPLPSVLLACLFLQRGDHCQATWLPGGKLQSRSFLSGDVCLGSWSVCRDSYPLFRVVYRLFAALQTRGLGEFSGPSGQLHVHEKTFFNLL